MIFFESTATSPLGILYLYFKMYFINAQILLDMSSCKNISLRRIGLTSDAGRYLSDQFNISLTDDEPHVAVIARNTSIIDVDV